MSVGCFERRSLYSEKKKYYNDVRFICSDFCFVFPERGNDGVQRLVVEKRSLQVSFECVYVCAVLLLLFLGRGRAGGMIFFFFKDYYVQFGT